MAYYCGECALWLRSGGKNMDGERWCPYSRRHEKGDRNTGGCKGFVYAGWLVVAKVCEIVDMPTEEYFRHFDKVKEEHLAPENIYLLSIYSEISPGLAENLDVVADRKTVARRLLTNYIDPAVERIKNKEYDEAAELYRQMVRELQERG